MLYKIVDVATTVQVMNFHFFMRNSVVFVSISWRNKHIIHITQPGCEEARRLACLQRQQQQQQDFYARSSSHDFAALCDFPDDVTAGCVWHLSLSSCWTRVSVELNRFGGRHRENNNHRVTSVWVMWGGEPADPAQQALLWLRTERPLPGPCSALRFWPG